MVKQSLKPPNAIRETIEEIWVLSDGVQLPLLKLLIEQIPHQTERWVHTDSHPVLPQDWISLRNQSHFIYRPISN